MQSKTVLFDRFGSASELYAAELSLPPLSSDQLLIKTAAAALNPIDAKIRNGSSFVCKNRPDPFPWTLGFDFAGTVMQSGADCKFKEGDNICGIVGHQFSPRAYSEYIISDERLIAKVPDSVSLKAAAALPTAGITALDILNTLKSVKDRGEVLVLGGSGGVGHILIQLLKLSGYKVTAGSSPQNMEFMLKLNADSVFNYHDDYKNRFKGKFDAAIDFIGDNVGIGLYEILNEEGLLITVPSYSFDKVLNACPAGKQARKVLCAPAVSKLKQLLELCAQEKLKVYIRKEFKLDTKGAQQAHLQIESTHTLGKIILVP